MTVPCGIADSTCTLSDAALSTTTCPGTVSCGAQCHVAHSVVQDGKEKKNSAKYLQGGSVLYKVLRYLPFQ